MALYRAFISQPKIPKAQEPQKRAAVQRLQNIRGLESQLTSHPLRD